MRTVSFRQSCIYGPRQFGIEDQGWVAWFTIAAGLGRPITIYGDGKQVRDVLFVEDLLRACEAALGTAAALDGQAFNIGGGPRNTMSLIDLTGLLEAELGLKLDVSYADWRPGDQRVFVCNVEKAARLLDWRPKVSARDGIARLIGWVRDNATLFRGMSKPAAAARARFRADAHA